MRTRVLIAGAGALGSVIGALLSKNAHVTLLGRKWHIDAINKKGLQITGVRNFVVNIRAVHDVNLLEKEYDYIFVTVKAYDTENIAIEMKEAGILAKGLVSFQNGVGNLEVLSQYFADLAIIGAVTTMGANVIGPGIVECAGIGDTYIGAWSRCSNAILHDLHTLLTSSAIPAQIVDDIEIKIWEKCAINSCINPLTAIFGIKNGELLKNKSLLKLMQIVAMEWGEVCRKAG
ncbi:MAG: 2-dehydropantoate 2-reductase, partial [Thermoplasmata archaeon]